MAIKKKFNLDSNTNRTPKNGRPHIIALKILIIVLLMAGPVQAGHTDSGTLSSETEAGVPGIDGCKRQSQSIEEVARQLTSTVQSVTVANIENYILYNFNYEFHWRPQETSKTWETKTGDCTDRSLIVVEMLEENGFENAKVVHGYVYDENGKKIKHDWVEVTVRVDGTGTFEKYEKIGDGIW